MTTDEIKKAAKDFCFRNFHKHCVNDCDECWQIHTPMGCEQYNMEQAFIAGVEFTIDYITKLLSKKS